MVDHHRPAALRGLSGISTLACNAQAVVIGLDDSASAYLYDRASHSFHSIELPPDTEVAGVALNERGDLAMGLRNYGEPSAPNRVLVRDAGVDETRIVTVKDSSTVHWNGRTLLAGRGAQIIEPGARKAGEDAVAKVTASGATLALQGPQPLPDGRLVAAATTGIWIAGPDGKSGTLDHTLGYASCEVVPMGKPKVIGHAVAPTTTDPSTCGIGTSLIATDQAGNVYAAMDNHVDLVHLP